MPLFNEHSIDCIAYAKGEAAWLEFCRTGIKAGNPYIIESDAWYSFNRGWNAQN